MAGREVRPGNEIRKRDGGNASVPYLYLNIPEGITGAAAGQTDLFSMQCPDTDRACRLLRFCRSEEQMECTDIAQNSGKSNRGRAFLLSKKLDF